MRSKTTPVGMQAAPEHRRIRSGLEQRGLDPELSQALAERLAPLSERLSGEAVDAVLDAVMLASGGGSLGARIPGGAAQAGELQRLVSGFAGELRKLEEALRILDAYVARMRGETSLPRELH